VTNNDGKSVLYMFLFNCFLPIDPDLIFNTRTHKANSHVCIHI